ncbi:MAG TPA: hypothetical protein VET88_06115 [Gammaproteobacteria bacterium]|nr:hypothetical protein [Gammaproteobacteria bacterium]
MARTAKKNSPVWYGFLQAGDRSSPVIRDDRLDTGNRKTLYLFNLARNSILEYSREIVESKLRELKPDESATVSELDAAYKKIRRSFKDRGAGVRSILNRSSAPASNEAVYNDIPAEEDSEEAWAEDDED